MGGDGFDLENFGKSGFCNAVATQKEQMSEKNFA